MKVPTKKTHKREKKQREVAAEVLQRERELAVSKLP